MIQRRRLLCRGVTPSRGFTLIELMITVLIAAILVLVGAPALGEFVADQRVRSVSSDIVADIAFARVKAIEESRRVFIERTGATWSNGWRIYVDQSNPPDNVYQVGVDVELKVFDGFAPGSMYVCSNVADFATDVSFRPDGRVWRSGAAAANDGIYIVDSMGDGVPATNTVGKVPLYKIRGLLFGTSGRVTVVRLNGVAAPC